MKPITPVRLPEIGFVRLAQIIGNPKADPPIPTAIIPVRRTCWLEGVKKGWYPKPVKIGPKVVAWKVEDIRALIERIAEDPIQKERDETIATAIEHADEASASMPTVSEPPMEPSRGLGQAQAALADLRKRTGRTYSAIIEEALLAASKR